MEEMIANKPEFMLEWKTMKMLGIVSIFTPMLLILFLRRKNFLYVTSMLLLLGSFSLIIVSNKMDDTMVEYREWEKEAFSYIQNLEQKEYELIDYHLYELKEGENPLKFYVELSFSDKGETKYYEGVIQIEIDNKIEKEVFESKYLNQTLDKHLEEGHYYPTIKTMSTDQIYINLKFDDEKVSKQNSFLENLKETGMKTDYTPPAITGFIMFLLVSLIAIGFNINYNRSRQEEVEVPKDENEIKEEEIKEEENKKRRIIRS